MLGICTQWKRTLPSLFAQWGCTAAAPLSLCSAHVWRVSISLPLDGRSWMNPQTRKLKERDCPRLKAGRTPKQAERSTRVEQGKLRCSTCYIHSTGPLGRISRLLCFDSARTAQIITRLGATQVHKSYDSAVGIATGYGLDDRGIAVRVPVGSRMFFTRRPYCKLILVVYIRI
jgi:hypothetical protein